LCRPDLVGKERSDTCRPGRLDVIRKMGTGAVKAGRPLLKLGRTACDLLAGLLEGGRDCEKACKERRKHR
jgi:hypothetical protein